MRKIILKIHSDSELIQVLLFLEWRREGETAAAEGSVCDRRNRWGLRYFQRAVGSRRVESAAIRGIGVSVHTATIDLSRAWETRERVPALEMAASTLRSTQVSDSNFSFCEEVLLCGSFFCFEAVPVQVVGESDQRTDRCRHLTGRAGGDCAWWHVRSCGRKVGLSWNIVNFVGQQKINFIPFFFLKSLTDKLCLNF